MTMLILEVVGENFQSLQSVEVMEEGEGERGLGITIIQVLLYT